ncbi:MAG: 23S rRNA (adenine(2503)-C(2))-methyltransferase RlmN [Dehalococcoidia bacterium]|nr:23S rRNA (adenine(2503)-C(2))-methyltransferase RlmN [Dehalococcoidia bacterium]
MKSRITDLSLAQLEALASSYGEPAYRARQIFQWLYKALANSFDEMTDLPAGFRQALAAETVLLGLSPLDETATDDGRTVKMLFKLEDGKSIESVLMLVEGTRGDSRWNTVCVSSQVGCSICCPFCGTGQQGFERNLSPGEIVEQVLYFQRQLANHYYDNTLAGLTPPHVSHVVFMGMGEPLANYESVSQAIETLISKQGLGISARHITVSTAGLTPQIERLANERFHVELAVSIHAANNELRNRLVPINRTYPLEVLIPAVKEYFKKTGRRPTFEYTLLEGINDSPQQAGELASLLRGLKCHVNLIPTSPTLSKEFLPSSKEQALGFQSELTRCRISNTLRVSRGLAIRAACGQLHSRWQATS